MVQRLGGTPGRVSTGGASHVAVEHLKVPVEAGPRWQRLERALGRRLREEYLASGARRDGREFVLPARAKLQRLLAARSEAHRVGITFGAADNEYQYLSDTDCCCSGVDQFPGFDRWYAFQVGAAVRRSRGGLISYGSIQAEWRPQGSIDRFLNSRSRLSPRERSSTASGHIRFRFGNPRADGSPLCFAGVVQTDRRLGGLPAFGWDEAHKRLWASLELDVKPRSDLLKRRVKVVEDRSGHCSQQ